MKIELVNPSPKLLNKHGQYSPPYGLAYIGTLLKQRDIEVKIIDEQVGERAEYNCDYAMITGTTSNIKQAYEISKRYMDKGIKTIIGGVHATSIINTRFKDELIGAASSIVIGPIEGIIDRIIFDMRASALQEYYVGASTNELHSPEPIWDLNNDQYFTYPVQSSVGCPFNCNFCAVNKIYETYKIKDKHLTLNEIHNASNTIIFLDDNLYGNPIHSKELFQDFKNTVGYKNWGGVSSLNVHKDEKLLTLFADTGCLCLNIGFETLDQQKLDSVEKRNRIDEYAKAIKTLNDYGILAYPGFISFPSDDDGTLSQLSDFLNKTDVDIFHYDFLTPFPGTKLFEELDSNSKIIDYDWSNYDFNHPVIEHNVWTTEEWVEKVENFYKTNLCSRATKVEQKIASNMAFTNQNLSKNIWYKLTNYLLGTFD